jgi:sugar lactone lactonase YvrE
MPQHSHHATLVFPGSTRLRTSDAHPTARRIERRGSSLTLAFTLGVTLAFPLGLIGARSVGRAASPTDTSAPAPAQTPAGLWLSSTGARAVVRLSPRQLATDGVVLPASMRSAAGLETHSLVGIAFDDSGRLWVANQADSLLLAFPPAGAASKERGVPATVLSASNRSLSAPVGLAFDRRHRLWTANFGNGTLVRFDPAQLSSSGAPVPSAIIGGLHRPSALAFDAAGTLWVSDMCVGSISAYDADQLEHSGSPVPRVVIRRTHGSLAIPTGLAFDADGNLWVANMGNGTVVGYGATQLASSGAPVPRVTLTMQQPGNVNNSPTGLALDGDGSLWVAELGGVVSKFTREQLAASGAPVPAVEVTVEGGGEGLLWGAAFWPKAPQVPLN